MPHKRLIAFDLDDTLAPSKSPLPEPVAEILVRLLADRQVLIISGGQVEQFRSQVLNRLPSGLAELDRLHLMPTCGTQYYRHREGQWEQVYAENLEPEQTRAALSALETRARELGLWEAQTWGPILEDRGSQVTFSALGQAAPVAAKKAWDPTGEKKERLREAVAADLPELEVRSGGSTSIDITRRGIDKAYGMRRMAEMSGLSFTDILFIGDRLDEGGNDYPVISLGIDCVAVHGWQDTVGYLEDLLGHESAEQ